MAGWFAAARRLGGWFGRPADEVEPVQVRESSPSRISTVDTDDDQVPVVVRLRSLRPRTLARQQSQTRVFGSDCLRSDYFNH